MKPIISDEAIAEIKAVADEQAEKERPDIKFTEGSLVTVHLDGIVTEVYNGKDEVDTWYKVLIGHGIEQYPSEIVYKRQ